MSILTQPRVFETTVHTAAACGDMALVIPVQNGGSKELPVCVKRSTKGAESGMFGSILTGQISETVRTNRGLFAIQN